MLNPFISRFEHKSSNRKIFRSSAPRRLAAELLRQQMQPQKHLSTAACTALPQKSVDIIFTNESSKNKL